MTVSGVVGGDGGGGKGGWRRGTCHHDITHRRVTTHRVPPWPPAVPEIQHHAPATATGNHPYLNRPLLFSGRAHSSITSDRLMPRVTGHTLCSRSDSKRSASPRSSSW